MKYLKQYEERFDNLVKYSKLIRDYFDYTKKTEVKIDPPLIYKNREYSYIYFDKKTRQIKVKASDYNKIFDPLIDGTMLIIKLYNYLETVTPEIKNYQKIKKNIDKFNL
jgi:hypothetical protein